jgi:NodT family efflux transporter outer membrane factor (OMF) lipoprotein
MYRNKISRSAILLLTIVLIGFTACRSYKDLGEAPQAETNGLVRDSAANSGDSTTIADIPWKEYFKDVKLQALIAEGLEKNYNMQIAMTRITQAEASLSMARGALLPSVAAAAKIDHTRLSSGADGTKVLGYSSNVNYLGFSAAWEIDLWGKLNNQSKAKYASYLSSNEYRNLIQTTLISNIATAYYNLLAYDEQLKVTKKTILLLEESAKTIFDLKEAGQQNAAAVEQSNALLYNTQLSIPKLESLIRKQENAISVLLGRNPGTIDRDSINAQIVSEKLAYGVPMQFLSKRPDVKQAEYSFRSAYALTNVAHANFYPSLTISSASLGFAAGEFSNFFKPEHIAAEIIAGVTQPIFNKKQLKGNLKIAQAQQDEALLTFKSTVLTAGQEVSDILFCYKSSLSKNEFRDKQVASLTKAVEYTHDLLMAGEANYTEVLSAQQSLLSAQLGKVDDKLEQLTYSVGLYKALGGGNK